MNKSSVASESAKRRRSQKKKSFSNVEYLEVTLNIVGPNSTPIKSKGKQLVVSLEESDADQSPGLNNVLIKPEEVY